MRKRTKITCAKQFLLTELAHDPVSSTRLVRRAAKQGIGRATLYKAARVLGVIQKTFGFGPAKSSLWVLGSDELQRLAALESYTIRHLDKIIWQTEQALEKAPTQRDTIMLERALVSLRRIKKTV